MIRIIPCLDVKEGRVVKGVNSVNLRDACDPVEAAEAYCRQGADELVFLDISATVENRKTTLAWVRQVAEKVTIPLTVGGGITSIGDMETLFESRADKISINTAAVKDPNLIKEASQRFGKRRVVVAIDGRKSESGLPRLEVVIKSGTEDAGLEVPEG